MWVVYFIMALAVMAFGWMGVLFAFTRGSLPGFMPDAMLAICTCGLGWMFILLTSFMRPLYKIQSDLQAIRSHLDEEGSQRLS